MEADAKPISNGSSAREPSSLFPEVPVLRVLLRDEETPRALGHGCFPARVGCRWKAGVPPEQGDLGYLVKLTAIQEKKKYILIQFEATLQSRDRKYRPCSQPGRLRPRKHPM